MKLFSFIVLLVLLSSCSVFNHLSKKKTVFRNDEESSITYNYAFTEATKQKLFGNYSQALALLFKCLDVNPSSSAAYYLVSEIYLKNNQLEKALEYCKLAVKYDERNNWYRLDLATLYKRSNYIDSSIMQYKIIVRRNPNNFRFKYNLAALYFENAQYNNSYKIIKELLKDDKKNQELAITKFQIERKLKRYHNAEMTLKRIFKKLPTEYKFLGLLAEHYKSIGKIEKGERTYKELLRRDSLNEIAIIGLATFFSETNRPGEVEKIVFDKLINDDQLSENEIIFLINTLKLKDISLNCKQDIIVSLKNWLFNHLDNEIDLKNLADVFIGSGFIKDASDILEFYYNQKLDAENLDLYLMILNLENRLDELISITDKRIEDGDQTDFIYYYRGIGYFKKHMFREAAGSFINGINFLNERKTYEEQLLILAGESYYKLGDSKTCFSYFDKVLEVNPYNFYVLNNYSFYLAANNDSLERAKEMSYKCIIMDTKNFNYLDTYGWILFKLGKYEEAYEVIKKALVLGGKSDINVQNHYNEILKIMNLKE